MKTCPCCEKTLERLTDFPQVEILQVRIHPYLGSIEESFTIEDNERYVDFDSKSDNEKVPKEVTIAVREQNKNEVIVDGWHYVKSGGVKGTNFYNRHKEDTTQRQKVEDILEKYFATLESNVDRTVKTSDVLPQLEKDKYFEWAYQMPGTIYVLGLFENKENSTDDVREVNVTILEDGPVSDGEMKEKVCDAATIRYRGKLNQ